VKDSSGPLFVISNWNFEGVVNSFIISLLMFVFSTVMSGWAVAWVASKRIVARSRKVSFFIKYWVGKKYLKIYVGEFRRGR